jgi:hypothetical protein
MEIRLLRLEGKFRTIPKGTNLILLEKLKIWSKQFQTSIYMAFEFAEDTNLVRHLNLTDFREEMCDKFWTERDEKRSIDGWVAFNINSFEKVWISEIDLKYIEEIQKATEIV